MNPYLITLHALGEATQWIPTWAFLGGLLALLAAWAMVTAPEDPYGCPCLECTPDRGTTQEHFPEVEEWRHG